MLKKSDLADPTVIEGWLRDLALTPIRRDDGANNWNVEFTITGGNPLVLSVVNPKSVPRAVMFVCGMLVAPEQVTAFNNLDEDQRKDFWQQLRSTLNREFVEFQVDGQAVVECPKAIRVTALRFDDGLTLDSFARTLSSVCKACSDAVAHFTDRLGDVRPPPAGEFAFKKGAVQ
jgi:hypothetical protein